MFVLRQDTKEVEFTDMYDYPNGALVSYHAGESGYMVVQVPSYKYWNTENKFVDAPEKCHVIYIENVERKPGYVTGDYHFTLDFSPDLLIELVKHPSLTF